MQTHADRLGRAKTCQPQRFTRPFNTKRRPSPGICRSHYTEPKIPRRTLVLPMHENISWYISKRHVALDHTFLCISRQHILCSLAVMPRSQFSKCLLCVMKQCMLLTVLLEPFQVCNIQTERLQSFALGFLNTLMGLGRRVQCQSELYYRISLSWFVPFEMCLKRARAMENTNLKHKFEEISLIYCNKYLSK